MQHVSAYTGSNSPLMLVRRSITLTCCTKLLLRFSCQRQTVSQSFLLAMLCSSSHFSVNFTRCILVLTCYNHVLTEDTHLSKQLCVQMMCKMNVKCLCCFQKSDPNFFRTICGRVKMSKGITKEQHCILYFHCCMPYFTYE